MIRAQDEQDAILATCNVPLGLSVDALIREAASGYGCFDTLLCDSATPHHALEAIGEVAREVGGVRRVVLCNQPATPSASATELAAALTGIVSFDENQMTGELELGQ